MGWDIHQRLNKLGDQPQRTNTSYAYDWLVALYTQGGENSTYQAPNNLSPQQYQQRLNILR